MPNQAQSQNKDSNIELRCYVNPFNVNSAQEFSPVQNLNSLNNVNSQQISLTGLAPGLYSLSTSTLKKNGLNIAIEEFMEPRPARKAVQHTLEGIFVDTYDVAPPMLTLMYAVEMPQAANLTTTDYYTTKGQSPSSGQSYFAQAGNALKGAATAALQTAGNLTGLSTLTGDGQIVSAFKRPPKKASLALSFTGILNLIYQVTSQRNLPNVATLIFDDYTRNIHHQISILNVTYRASVSRQNVLIAQVDAVVVRPDVGINQKYPTTSQPTSSSSNFQAPGTTR